MLNTTKYSQLQCIFLGNYNRIPVTRTLYNSNLPLTQSNYISLQIVFYIILPSITRTPDNSNFFLFPLKVRIIGSQLYIKEPTQHKFVLISIKGEKCRFFVRVFITLIIILSPNLLSSPDKCLGLLQYIFEEVVAE